MLSVLITRDMCNERKKCTHSTHHRAGPGSSSHIVTILAADLRPSDTTQISYIQQIYSLFQSVFLVSLEVQTHSMFNSLNWLTNRVTSDIKCPPPTSLTTSIVVQCTELLLDDILSFLTRKFTLLLQF